MAGAWEIKESNKVVCAILHTDSTTVAWAFGLRNLMLPGREELRRFNPFLPISGLPFDHGRNLSAMAMLDLRAQWLFSLDSDVVPPHDAILRLLKHNQPFISGLYARRSPPVGVPVMQRNGMWVTNYRPGSVIEVDVVGSGCMLVHRSVYERLPPQRPEAGKHWYDWRVDMKDNPHYKKGSPMSEDFTFCESVRRDLGIKILVDTSVVCRHLGGSEAMPGVFQAMQTIPST
mgnify:CR=1 FL=1